MSNENITYRIIEDNEMQMLIEFIRDGLNESQYYYNNINYYNDERVLREGFHNFYIFVFGAFCDNKLKDIVLFRMPTMQDKFTFAILEIFPKTNKKILEKSLEFFKEEINEDNNLTKIKLEIGEETLSNNTKSILEGCEFKNELIIEAQNGKEYTYSVFL